MSGKPKAAAGAAASKSTDDAQTLPAKEQRLLRDTSQLYDTGMYKKALRATDTIMKKFPRHGETMAMKALVIYKLDRKAEALALAQESVSINSKTHLTWHVLSILQRDEKNYVEAVKSLKQAIRMSEASGRKNTSLRRDVAYMALHMRDLRGFQNEMHELLAGEGAKQPGVWIGCAAANHLVGNRDAAVDVLRSYEATLEPKRPRTADDQELSLYRAQLLIESDNFEAALAEVEAGCRDESIRSAEEADAHRAGLLLRLGRTTDAVAPLERLWARHPDNLAYAAALILCNIGALPDTLAPGVDPATATAASWAGASASASWTQWRDPDFASGTQFDLPASPLARAPRLRASELSAEQVERLAALLHRWRSAAPRAALPRALILRVLPASHPDFTAGLEADLRDAVNRARGTAIATLAPLYSSAARAAAATSASSDAAAAADGAGAGARARSFSEAMMEDAKVRVIDTVTAAIVEDTRALAVAGASSTATESVPSAFIYAVLNRVAHLAAVGRDADAVPLLDEAIEHTPTCSDLYLARARALGALGAWQRASADAESGRCLDLADRAANCETVMAMCRAGHTARAETIASHFARQEGDALMYFKGMQTFWLEIATARSYEQAGESGRALRRYGWLVDQVDGLWEDQYDYYGYCMRKIRPRPLIRLLRWESTLASRDAFAEALAGRVRGWLALADAAAAATAARASASSTTAAASGDATEDGEAGASDSSDAGLDFAFKSEAELAAMTTKDRKRYKDELRKARKKRDEAQAAAAAASASASSSGAGGTTDGDDSSSSAAAASKKPKPEFEPEKDPQGQTELSDPDPLGRAAKDARRLVDSLEAARDAMCGGGSRAGFRRRAALLAAAAAVEVAVRRDKPLLAIRALTAASAAFVDTTTTTTTTASSSTSASPAAAAAAPISAAVVQDPLVLAAAARFIALAHDAARRASWPEPVRAIVDAALTETSAWGDSSSARSFLDAIATTQDATATPALLIALAGALVATNDDASTSDRATSFLQRVVDHPRADVDTVAEAVRALGRLPPGSRGTSEAAAAAAALEESARVRAAARFPLADAFRRSE